MMRKGRRRAKGGGGGGGGGGDDVYEAEERLADEEKGNRMRFDVCATSLTL